jgi:predicted SnoaL-like aldol condensation-catalyzing enzyme
MTEVAANKALVSAYIEALNKQDWEAVRRLCSPAYVHHAPRVPAASLAMYIETAARLFSASPTWWRRLISLRAGGDVSGKGGA